jgi:hypothetical protein
MRSAGVFRRYSREVETGRRRTLMVRWLGIVVDDALLVDGFERSEICRAIGNASY